MCETPIKNREVTVMQQARRRLTIGSLMIAIAVMACLLALPGWTAFLMIALAVPCFAAIAAERLVFRRRLRLAAFSFWIVAMLANLLTVVYCIAADSRALTPMTYGIVIVATPTIFALGTAWGILLLRQRTLTPCAHNAARWSVFVLAVLPVFTLSTYWPVHIAFLAARAPLNQSGPGRELILPGE
jgi:hypothetical protein